MKRISFFATFLTFFVLLLTTAPPVTGQSKKDKDEAKKLQDQADKAIGLKNYREAAELYGRSLALVTNNNYAHYRKGFAHLSLKENEQAITEFTLALDQGFKPPVEIYRIRYFIYLEQGNYDAALADIAKAMQITPNDINLTKAVGEINFARKNYPESLAAFQKAAVLAPASGDIFYQLARVHQALGDTKAQAKAAEDALVKGTTFPGETYFLLGGASEKLKNIPAAIDAYQKALAVKPKLYQAYQRLAEIYSGEAQYPEAIAILRKALLQFSGDGRIYTDIALYYSLAGRHDDAVAAARAAIQLLPNEAQGYSNLCRAYNGVGSFEMAVSACNHSLQLRPGDGDANYYLGNALASLKRDAEATRAYSNAVMGLVESTAKNPDQPESWYLLGNAYFADRQYDKAIESYQKSLSISPKFLNARVNLGISYTRKKNKAAATEQYNMLLAVDPALAARVKAEIDNM